MLLVVVVASVLVVLIYSLPKVVVSDDEGNLESETTTEDVHIHDESGSESKPDPEQLRKLRSDFGDGSAENYNPEWALALADLYTDMGYYDSALWVADRLSNDGFQKEQHFIKGRTFLFQMRNGDSEPEAMKFADSSEYHFKLVLNDEPENLRTMNLLAEVYLNKQEVMRSVQLLKKIVEIDPGNAEAQFQLGILSIQSQQFDKGVDRFRKVIESDSSNVKAFYWLAYCLVNTGASDEADDVISKAKTLTSDPEVLAALESLVENI